MKRTEDRRSKEAPPREADENSYEYMARLRDQEEAFQAEDEIEGAIHEWESHNRQLYEVHFYWLAGFAISLVGAVIYMRIQCWAGISLCALGTLEMIWTTSPSYRTFGWQIEFDRLLTFKLIYSAASVLAVCIGWVIASRMAKRL